jgi:hypothetical protein
VYQEIEAVKIEAWQTLLPTPVANQYATGVIEAWN